MEGVMEDRESGDAVEAMVSIAISIARRKVDRECLRRRDMLVDVVVVVCALMAVADGDAGYRCSLLLCMSQMIKLKTVPLIYLNACKVLLMSNAIPYMSHAYHEARLLTLINHLHTKVALLSLICGELI